jgi:DNA mismatch repair ATPase MutS
MVLMNLNIDIIFDQCFRDKVFITNQDGVIVSKSDIYSLDRLNIVPFYAYKSVLVDNYNEMIELIEKTINRSNQLIKDELLTAFSNCIINLEYQQLLNEYMQIINIDKTDLLNISKKALTRIEFNDYQYIIDIFKYKFLAYYKALLDEVRTWSENNE